ncbi:MAG: hypothetical protein H7Y12_06450 [Sphingobacteriaceae bacterium]|nr:hypothetical protein [Cytophagaceae bacterium]
MSRSRIKTAVFGYTTATSDKIGKQQANRRYRRRVNQTLQNQPELLPQLRELTCVWDMPKDGKGFWKEAHEEAFRK